MALLVVNWAVLASDEAQANDLIEAYRLALAQDTVLQAAQRQHDARIEAQPQALATLLPQLSADGSVAREVQRIPAFDSEGVSKVGMRNFYGNNRGYGLVLTQTLWDLKSLHQWQEAQLLVSQSDATLRAAEQRLILRVASAYFDILSSADQLAAYRSQRDAFGKMLHQAQVLQETGIKARTDVEDAQAFYDRTAQNVIDAENALEDAKRALAVSTGRYLDTFSALTPEIPLVRPMPDDAEAWARAANEDNFEVRAAAFGAEAAERNIATQRAKHWPTFALQAAATREQRRDVLGGDQDVGSAALTFSWPLYQGGAVQSQIREAEALHKQAVADYETTRLQAERAARNAYRGATVGVERVQAAKRAAESGAAAVEASRRGVEFGTRSEFDLLNTQNNYYIALRAYQQSRYDYLRAVLTLKQQAGRLTEADLHEIDRLLTERPQGEFSSTKISESADAS